MYHSAEPLPGSRTDDRSIVRTCSSINLAGLWDPALLNASARNLRSSSARRQSEDHLSENSQALYIAERRGSRRSQPTLTSRSNGSSDVLDGPSDYKPKTKAATTDEDFSWDIIDREISDWQHVCQTGRPYWWARDSKYAPTRRIHQRTAIDQTPPTWSRDRNDGSLKHTYERQRRNATDSCTDSCFKDPAEANEMTQLIAIQLLGSCFTLPLDATTGTAFPNRTMFDQERSSYKTKMISALRMHTQFRYSPCFGHEARNTSPAQRWETAEDETSEMASTFTTTGLGPQIPHIGTQMIIPKSQRLRCALSITGCSEVESCSNSQVGKYVSSTESPEAITRSTIPKTYPRGTKICHVSNKSNYEGSRSPEITPATSMRSLKADESHEYTSMPPSQPANFRYRLQSVIQCEPHHLFVQPVKEFVIQGWRRSRRRFRGSLHARMHSEDGPASEYGSIESGSSSQGVSSDGKKRRRRAQQRGEIHSSSIDTRAHCNTSASDNSSSSRGLPQSSSSCDLANARLKFESTDPLVAVTGMVAAGPDSVPLERSTPLIDSPEGDAPGHGDTSFCFKDTGRNLEGVDPQAI